jgi:hypothetical protein
MDTDNRTIMINVPGAALSSTKLPLAFEGNSIIDDIRFDRVGNDVHIAILTHIVYYAETFNLREGDGLQVYKVVVDIYRQREPSTVEQARNYITFYETVRYFDRAAALRRRWNLHDFRVTPPTATIPILSPTPIVTPPPPPPPPPPMIPVTPLPDYNLMLDNPLQYLKPDVTMLSDVQRNWINEAFSIYDLFKNIHNIIEQAERTLRLYDTQRTVNISFVDSMSRSYNSLSHVNIQINELRLQFNNILHRRTFPSNSQVEYTTTMIHHVLRTMDSYQNTVNGLQIEYDSRINR